MASKLDEKIEPIFQQVVNRNPGEGEFHQAVREVLESLGPVLAKYPEFAHHKIIERICEPERQIIFRVPWMDTNKEVRINRGFRVQFRNGDEITSASRRTDLGRSIPDIFCKTSSFSTEQPCISPMKTAIELKHTESIEVEREDCQQMCRKREKDY